MNLLFILTMNFLNLKIIRPLSRKTEIRTRLIINKKIMIDFRETYMGKSVKVDYDFLKNDIVLAIYITYIASIDKNR